MFFSFLCNLFISLFLLIYYFPLRFGFHILWLVFLLLLFQTAFINCVPYFSIIIVLFLILINSFSSPSLTPLDICSDIVLVAFALLFFFFLLVHILSFLYFMFIYNVKYKYNDHLFNDKL